MDKNKIHGFIDQLNLFFIGAVIGTIIGACFSVNVYKGKSNKAEEKVKAYEEYYKCTETLLDSLDGTHDLDLMDTDLETDYGVDYLEAKSKVDELIAKQNGERMQPQGVQSLQRETELQMEHKAQVQVRSSPIQVNNVLNYQNYEHFREIAG